MKATYLRKLLCASKFTSPENILTNDMFLILTRDKILIQDLRTILL
jgi:hypothetical protein